MQSPQVLQPWPPGHYCLGWPGLGQPSTLAGLACPSLSRAHLSFRFLVCRPQGMIVVSQTYLKVLSPPSLYFCSRDGSLHKKKPIPSTLKYFMFCFCIFSLKFPIIWADLVIYTSSTRFGRLRISSLSLLGIHSPQI